MRSFENLIICGITTTLFSSTLNSFAKQLPDGFIYVRDTIPDIILEMRYCSNKNFIGQSVDGYIKPKAILTLKTAKSLKDVQDELRNYNFSLRNCQEIT